MSNIPISDDANELFHIRWRGREEGPYTAKVIEEKLASNQIGLLHEISHDGQWHSIRDYLSEREAAARAIQKAREEQERIAREESERREREIAEAKRREHEDASRSKDAGSSASSRMDLLETAVLAALRPKYAKWPWVLFGIFIFFWYSCSEWQSSLVAEAQQYLQVSQEMNSANYRFGKGLEAFVRGYSGDPFGVAKEEFEKEEKIKQELQRIDSEYKTARNASTIWFVAALVALGMAIWKHVNYKKSALTRLPTR